MMKHQEIAEQLGEYDPATDRAMGRLMDHESSQTIDDTEILVLWCGITPAGRG
jgi:hypothetical protein